MKNIASFILLGLVCNIASAQDTAALDWKPLFNGKNFEGWEVCLPGQAIDEDKKGYFSIHDGMIHTYRNHDPDERVTYGVVVTKKSYSHYRLRFEYKWGSERFHPRKKTVRDAGLLFHCYEPNRKRWLGKGTWPLSVECQVQEHDTGDAILVKAQGRAFVDPNSPDAPDASVIYLSKAEGGVQRNFTGGGGRIRRGKESDRLDGWNQVEVEIRGDEARYWVNGRFVLELRGMEKPVVVNGKTTWEPLVRGKISFQCEAAEVFYRKIELALLPEVGFSSVK